MPFVPTNTVVVSSAENAVPSITDCECQMKFSGLYDDDAEEESSGCVCSMQIVGSKFWIAHARK